MPVFTELVFTPRVYRERARHKLPSAPARQGTLLEARRSPGSSNAWNLNSGRRPPLSDGPLAHSQETGF